MSNKRLIDGEKLLDAIGHDMRLYKELGPSFDERRYEPIGWEAKLNRGDFDIPSNQGEAARLREALEKIFTESSYESDYPGTQLSKIQDYAGEALSSHTEDTGIRLRPEVQWFAEQMELTLRANDHKGGWSEMSYRQLRNRLNEEIEELESAYYAGRNADMVVREASDVANFAMMIADNMRNFIPPGITDGGETE